MQRQQIPAMTQDVVESGCMTAKNVIATGRAGTRRVLGACDQVWNAGANTLGYNPGLISEQLRDDLVSLQSQLTLITAYLAHTAADRTECAVNGIADAASSTVGEYERVFDLRVMQTLTRVGTPLVEVIRTLAELVASLSQELAGLVAIQGIEFPAAERPDSKPAVKAARNPARRTKRAKERH